MSRDEVAALAKALALANGHSDADGYAQAVADAYVEPDDVAEARRDEAKGSE